LRRAEEAWHDPAFFDFVKDDAGITAGWVPKPTADPNRLLIPTKEEIAKLPRWAQVAFAARCARRVLPLYRYFHPHSSREEFEALKRGVARTEQTAADGIINTPPPYAQAAATAATYASYIASIQDSREVDAARNSQVTYSDTAAAIQATASAATRAAFCAVESLIPVVRVGTTEILAAPARDFERLQQLAARYAWTDTTPVPPSVFGPMWDGTPPAWWTDDILTASPPEPITEPEITDTEQVTPSDDAA
jgi:hypothetical protein